MKTEDFKEEENRLIILIRIDKEITIAMVEIIMEVELKDKDNHLIRDKEKENLKA
jgi:hypothetical protein